MHPLPSATMLSGERLYIVNAVDFDGTNDYLRRVANVTNLADARTGLFSGWFRIDSGSAGTLIASTTLASSSSRFNIQRVTNRFEIEGQTIGGVVTLSIRTTNQYLSGTTWRHFLASWDMAVAGARQIYINDVADLTQTTFVNNIIDYTQGDFSVGGLADGTDKFNGCMAEIYFTNTYLDLTVEANRRKFISVTGKPVNLGANGSRPTGSQPPLYLKGDATAFTVNSGSGGNFTLTGALTAASTSPSD